jgi:hypothetical protein
MECVSDEEYFSAEDLFDCASDSDVTELVKRVDLKPEFTYTSSPDGTIWVLPMPRTESDIQRTKICATDNEIQPCDAPIKRGVDDKPVSKEKTPHHSATVQENASKLEA